MNLAFEKTKIFPDNKLNPTDTVITVNGVDVKMVGIRSGKVCCEGLRDTIELQYCRNRGHTETLDGNNGE